MSTSVTVKVLLCLYLATITLRRADTQGLVHNASQVRTVEIEPEWSGHRAQNASGILIRRDQHLFQRSWHTANGLTGSDEVAESTIEALVRALQSPTFTAPNVTNLGITPSWLAKEASEDPKPTSDRMDVSNEKQRAFFQRSVTDMSIVEKLLPGVVAERWTDDGAWVHISIVFSDGTQWKAETTALPPFMLPWVSTVSGRTTRTYNADISRAVADLLPPGTVNKDRLAGVGLGRLISSAVEQSVRPEWDRIHAEAQAGPDITVLREHYIIRRSQVSSYQNLVSNWLGTSLQADVRLKSFPENLVVALIVPLQEQQGPEIAPFLQSGEKYESLVLSNPWLMKSLRKHPDLGAWLYFVSDASFSEAAMQVFIADMHEVGRDDIVAEVEGHRREVALLNYYGNQLIIFPDKHAIVWRWGANRELFSWKASSLTPKRCSAYNTVTEGCVGAVITSSGELLK
jgi:hypothetical protein